MKFDFLELFTVGNGSVSPKVTVEFDDSTYRPGMNIHNDTLLWGLPFGYLIGSPLEASVLGLDHYRIHGFFPPPINLEKLFGIEDGKLLPKVRIQYQQMTFAPGLTVPIGTFFPEIQLDLLSLGNFEVEVRNNTFEIKNFIYP